MRADSITVAIVGGGIGGLTLALALQRRGFRVKVFERAAALQPVGAGIILAINAMRVFSGLGLQDELLAKGRQVFNTELETANGTSMGVHRLEPFSKQYGGISIAIHRADLHATLAHALSPGTLFLGEELSAINDSPDSAQAVFKSGLRERADCIVGADGLNSAVRRILFPSEGPPRYAGYTCWRGICDLRECAAPTLLDKVSETWGRGARFGMVPIDAHRVYWFATLNAPQNQRLSAEESRATVMRTFGSWHAPIEAILNATKPGNILHHDILDRTPINDWSKGRVILLGDAAHPTTPNMGQGVAMAIESAAVFAAALEREASLDAAFQLHQRIRQPRTRWVTEQSWTFGRIGQMQNAIGVYLRDLAMRLAPASAQTRPMHRLFAYDCSKLD